MTSPFSFMPLLSDVPNEIAMTLPYSERQEAGASLALLLRSTPRGMRRKTTSSSTDQSIVRPVTTVFSASTKVMREQADASVIASAAESNTAEAAREV